MHIHQHHESLRSKNTITRVKEQIIFHPSIFTFSIQIFFSISKQGLLIAIKNKLPTIFNFNNAIGLTGTNWIISNPSIT